MVIRFVQHRMTGANVWGTSSPGKGLAAFFANVTIIVLILGHYCNHAMII